MAEGFNPRTIARIWRAIAQRGEQGIDVCALVQATDLNENTVKIYCRRMERHGWIAIRKEQQDRGEWIATINVYLAMTKPEFDSSKQLMAMVETLRPLLRGKKTREELIQGIKDALEASK